MIIIIKCYLSSFNVDQLFLSKQLNIKKRRRHIRLMSPKIVAGLLQNKHELDQYTMKYPESLNLHMKLSLQSISFRYQKGKSQRK